MKLVYSWDVGQRVALHPATDAWMRGARYGQIVKLGRKYVHVRLEGPMGHPLSYVIRVPLETDLIEPME